MPGITQIAPSVLIRSPLRRSCFGERLAMAIERLRAAELELYLDTHQSTYIGVILSPIKPPDHMHAKGLRCEEIRIWDTTGCVANRSPPNLGASLGDADAHVSCCSACNTHGLCCAAQIGRCVMCQARLSGYVR